MKKHSWKGLLALLALVLVVGLGAKMYSNITMGDDEWIGIGAASERIVFDAAGDITVMGANFGVNEAAPAYPFDVAGNIRTQRSLIAGGTPWPDDGSLYLRNAAGANAVLLRSNGVSYFNSGNVGVGDSTPSYDLDVAGDIRATDDIFVNDDLLAGGEVHTGPDVTDIDDRSDMPFATAEDGQGGYFFYNANVSADTDLTGVYSTEANVERQCWVRWLVYDVTAATRHYGTTVLSYTGGLQSVVIADEGANDLLFKVTRGAPPNDDGYICLDVVGNHTYEVVLMTMWH